MTNQTADVNDKQPVTDISRRAETLLVVGMLIILGIVIGIVVWQTEEIGLEYVHNNNYHSLTSPRSGQIAWPLRSGSAILENDLSLTLLMPEQRVTLKGKLNFGFNSNDPYDCSGISKSDICLEWENDRRLIINRTSESSSQLDCYELEWTALSCTNQMLIDCFNITSAHWYGGYQDKMQFWPFETTNRTIVPYVANDSYIGEIGGVLERYFFSSSGTGLFIDKDVPLYFSINNPTGMMCFSAKYEKYPYSNYNQTYPFLHYKLCQAGNIKDIHLKMAELFIPRPFAIPDESLFRYPIWSTWAQFHKDINQTNVLSFAHAILQNNFTHAQIEIDDDWTPAYGDMRFNEKKFPNATAMIKTLNSLGYSVTVWVHPFFNLDSQSFIEAASKSYLIRAYESPRPVLTSWWDGKLAGILDPSNPDAVTWYLQKLEFLKTKYNVSSFKFDAGEAAWLPHIYSAAATPQDPGDIYPQSWIELAAKADLSHRQEVRVGYHTQRMPIFVRMMDKLSNWGHDNALKSVIPCALTFGILGYPFILPDMIGGNAYNDKPDPELYIRWLQLNTFLPSMQFSIPPWLYNDTVVEIVQKYTKLHEQYSDIIIELARESVHNGSPIIRPIWWLEPFNEDALTCDDEFLVGDTILVAPVLEQGSRTRDIYIPPGTWYDMLNNVTITGGRWVRNYYVDIDELAFFTKITEKY